MLWESPELLLVIIPVVLAVLPVLFWLRSLSRRAAREHAQLDNQEQPERVVERQHIAHGIRTEKEFLRSAGGVGPQPPVLRAIMEAPLTIAILDEDDGRWVAEVVELPGVLAYGPTRREAVERVQGLALRVLADRLDHGERVPDLSGLFTIEAPGEIQ
jgi:predicted RNase H-like HicB family nuclease